MQPEPTEVPSHEPIDQSPQSTSSAQHGFWTDHQLFSDSSPPRDAVDSHALLDSEADFLSSGSAESAERGKSNAGRLSANHPSSQTELLVDCTGKRPKSKAQSKRKDGMVKAEAGQMSFKRKPRLSIDDVPNGTLSKPISISSYSKLS